MAKRKRKSGFKVTPHVDREILQNLYWNEKLSMREIAEKLRYTRGKVLGDLRYWSIPLRSHSEAMKLKLLKSPKFYELLLSNGASNRFKNGHKLLGEVERKRIENIRGYRHTEEWKSLMSKKMKGRQLNEEWRKKLAMAKLKNPVRYWLGKKRPEVKNWLTQPFEQGHVPWNKGLKGFMAGEQNPSWQGGISKEPYSFGFDEELKEFVRQRDNYKCQLCGLSGGGDGKKLDVHHIDYNKKNSNPNNLIVLCKPCHQKAQFNRNYWATHF